MKNEQNQKLLSKSTLTLAKATEIAVAMETVSKDASELFKSKNNFIRKKNQVQAPATIASIRFSHLPNVISWKPHVDI